MRLPGTAVAAAALIVLADCRPAAAAGNAGASNVIVIAHVSVADASSDQARPDMTVVIRDGAILAVGASGAVAVPAGARIVDGRGMYLIPGLWDMHVHVSYEGAWALGEYARHGITSVRDMGSEIELIDSVRREISRGARVGPRIVAVGAMLESPGAMLGILAGVTSDDSARVRRNYLPVATPAAARRAVDSLARLGVDLIKGRDFVDVDTYWAIAIAARRAGLPFVGHAPFGLAIDPIALADSGQQSLEHWYFPADLPARARAEYDAVVAAYVRRGVVLAPTLGAWRPHRFVVDSLERLLSAAEHDPRAVNLPPQLLRLWRRDLSARRLEQNGKPATAAELGGWNRALDTFARETGKLANAGMIIVAASDLPFAKFPGDALHDELALLVSEAGLTPRQALESATLSPARSLKMQDSLGTVAAGKRADLVILDANPLESIANVRRVKAVIQGGRWTIPLPPADR